MVLRDLDQCYFDTKILGCQVYLNPPKSSSSKFRERIAINNRIEGGKETGTVAPQMRGGIPEVPRVREVYLSIL